MHPRCGGLPVLEDNEFRNWSVNTLVIDPINTNALSQKACLIHAANILFQHCTSRQAWFCYFVCICAILYWVLFEFKQFDLLLLFSMSYMAPAKEVHGSCFACWSQASSLWSRIEVKSQVFCFKLYVLALKNSTLLHCRIPSHIFLWIKSQQCIAYLHKPAKASPIILAFWLQ